MKRKLLVGVGIGFGVGLVLIVLVGAADVIYQLTTIDGSSTWEVRDSGGVVVAQIDSDGNTQCNGYLQCDSNLTVNGTGLSSIAGNLGIGTTSPGTRLHISSGSSMSIALSDTGGDVNHKTMRINYDGSTTDALDRITIQGATDAGGWVSNLVSFHRDGKVGIGTTAPAFGLDVSHASATIGTIGTRTLRVRHIDGKAPTTTDEDTLYLQYLADGKGVRIGDTGTDHPLNVYGQGYFAGKVGIGDSAPRNLFEINTGGVESKGMHITGGESATMYCNYFAGGMYLKLLDDAGNQNIVFRTYSDSYVRGGRFGVGNGATTPASALEVDGGVNIGGTSGVSDNDLYVTDNCSAQSFTDRTSFYAGDAVRGIKNIKADAKGKLDHSSLPPFVRKQIKLGILDEKTGEKIGEIVEEGRNLGNMVSMLTVAIQQLTERIEVLENK